MPCGVIGIYNLEKVSYNLFAAGTGLNHRGQDGVGIAVWDGIKPRETRIPGLVSEALTEELLLKFKGKHGILHLRYPTVKVSNKRVKDQNKLREKVVEHGAPVSIKWPFYLSVVHNADVESQIYDSRKRHIRSWGDIIESGSDAQIYMRYQTHFLRDTKKINNDHIFQAAKFLMENVPGAYSLVELFAQGNGKEDNVKLIGITDPKRIRPLVLGKKVMGDQTSYMLASETCALDAVGFKLEMHIPGGSCVIIDKDGCHFKRLIETNPQYCMFEWAYFARPDSVIAGVPVWKVRYNLGFNLGKKDNIEADVVIPILNSGFWNAIGYSEAKKIRMVPALYKNEYVGRTFISDSFSRDIKLSLKQNPIRELIEGKRVVLVDDSIVRGNTMRNIVDAVLGAGAKEVHIRIGTPPILHPCHWAIDMKTYEQFIARGKDCKEIAKELHANSVIYNTIEELVKAIGLKETDICLHCLNGKKPYPDAWGANKSGWPFFKQIKLS